MPLRHRTPARDIKAEEAKPELETALANSICNCSGEDNPPGRAPLAKSAICGSKIRRIFPNANYSNLPLPEQHPGAQKFWWRNHNPKRSQSGISRAKSVAS